jgi:hypothetical protein
MRIKKMLTNVQVFPKNGKQGICGTCTLDDDKRALVFKLSRYFDNSVIHEYHVMQSLRSLSDFCPNFSTMSNILMQPVSPNFRTSARPFQKSSYIKPTLVMEYISNVGDLYSIIKDPKSPDKLILSCLKQTMCALMLGQKECDFVHNDIHSSNILVQPVQENMSFLYVVDDANLFYVPGYGHMAVMMDYGFSYSKDLRDTPLMCSMAHTEYGFRPTAFDPLSDIILLLVSLSEEYRLRHPGKSATKLRNVVRNLFEGLSIDWQSGWSLYHGASALIDVLDRTDRYVQKSALLTDYFPFCIDILQTLVTHPLRKRSTQNFKIYARTLAEQLCILETAVDNAFKELYILNRIVNSAAQLRKNYVDDPEKTTVYFAETVIKIINDVIPYCKVDFDYERLLCSLYLFAECMEHIMYRNMQRGDRDKQKEYDALPLKTVQQIYATVDINLPIDTTMTPETKIYVIDYPRRTTDMFALGEDATHVNTLPAYSKGGHLNRLYQKHRFKNSDSVSSEG